MTDHRSIKIAYTPDSDDAFAFYAWEKGHVQVDGIKPEFFRDHIGNLNQAAKEHQFDVVAISSAFFPTVSNDYAILKVGNSICRNCGPVLVSKDIHKIDDLSGKKIGVGGEITTGGSLARMFVPDAEYVCYPFDKIIGAIESNQLSAGVMIHEEIIEYERAGLHCLLDLGSEWYFQTGLPLPVGLNVINKSLGLETMRQIATGCERSYAWAIENRAFALKFASQFGRHFADDHLKMFEHRDSLRTNDEVHKGMRAMFDRIEDMGLGPHVADFELIQGDLSDDEINSISGTIQ